MTGSRSSSSASGRATRRSGPARTRPGGSAGSTSRRAVLEDVDLLLTLADARRGRDRRRRAARHGRLVARAGGAAADVRRRALPRARHDAPAGDPRRSQAKLDLERTLFVSASKSGGDARDALAHRLLLEARAARRGSGSRSPIPGSALEQLAREREFRAIFPGEPTIGGRYSALSPFGLVPAALLGVDLAAAARARARDGRGVPARRGQPGARARALARRRAGRRAATRSASPDPDGFGLWVEQLRRRVDRQGGQGPRAGARASRPTAPTGRRRRCALDVAVRARPGVLPLGVRDRGRRLDPRHQPVRPAERAGGEGQDERGARGRRRRARADEGSLDELLALGAGRATTSASRRSSTRPPAADEAIARARRARPRGDRLRRDARLRPALPALDRPAAQGRRRTPASSSRSSTTPARSCRSPASRSASARLIRAQAAGDFASLRERGRRVGARPHGESLACSSG